MEIVLILIFEHFTRRCSVNPRNANALGRTKQGRNDGGIWVYKPPKSVQVDFLWSKNDVKTTIEQEY